MNASSFQVNNWGFIPQDRPQSYSWEEAGKQCAINFGPEFELATFANQAEVDSVVAIMNNNGINDHAYWTGQTHSNGQVSPSFDGVFPWMGNEPSEGGQVLTVKSSPVYA